MERQTRISITSAEHITLTSPKGSMALRWDGSQLVGAGRALRLSAEKTAEVAAAVSAASPAQIDRRYGYQIVDGDRAGWQFVDVEGDAHGLYERVAVEAITSVVMIGRMDLVA